jgi:hypothetical protein
MRTQVSADQGLNGTGHSAERRVSPRKANFCERGVFALWVSLFLVACSSIQGVSSGNKSENTKVDPVPDGSPVVVIPNPYVDDGTLADAEATQARTELTKRGYHIVSDETEAQLVAIPTVETNFVTAANDTPDTSAAALTPQMDRPGMLVNSFGSMPSFLGPKRSGAVKPGGRVLVIEAFKKDAWDKALIVNELQLAPDWKLRMPLPRELEPAVEGADFVHTADTQSVLPPGH